MKKVKINPPITTIGHQLTQLLGETAYIRGDINTIKAEMGIVNDKLGNLDNKLSSLDNRLGNLEETTKKLGANNEKDHEEIIETVKEFIGGGYDLLDKRVSKLETKVFNTL